MAFIDPSDIRILLYHNNLSISTICYQIVMSCFIVCVNMYIHPFIEKILRTKLTR